MSGDKRLSSAVPTPSKISSIDSKANHTAPVLTSEDVDSLSINEYQRYWPNSSTVGHALVYKDSSGKLVAEQYAIPQGHAKGTPSFVALRDINMTFAYGAERFKAKTLNGATEMCSTRSVTVDLKPKSTMDVSDSKEDEPQENKPHLATLHFFSPVKKSKGSKEPFWGSTKPVPVWQDAKTIDSLNVHDLSFDEDDSDLSDLDLEEENFVKGGRTLVIDPDSVRARDLVKNRTPTQKEVMGNRSAQDIFRRFLQQMQQVKNAKKKLTPEILEIFLKTIDAPFRGGADAKTRTGKWTNKNLYGELLHVESHGLTPLWEEPQRIDNLAAGPKWANTKMMILERFAKYAALHWPEAYVAIKSEFLMLVNSHIAQHIDLEVSIEEKGRFITVMQSIDPFQAYPQYSKASDLTQTTAVAFNLLNSVPPSITQTVSFAKNKLKEESSMPKSSSSSKKSKKEAQQSFNSESSSQTVQPVQTGYMVDKGTQTLSDPTPPPMLFSVPSSQKASISSINSYEKSAVQVWVTAQESSYAMPWLGSMPLEWRGSGFVVAGPRGKKYIVTNAHVADNSVHMRIKIGSEAHLEYVAEPKVVCYDSDLALLEVQDPDFQNQVKPLTLGKMVAIEDEIRIVGYPVGGTNLSVTKGVVSRIQTDVCEIGGTRILQVQVDAAINPGNSGGAAIAEGKVVGVAFQGIDGGDGLGYIISLPVLEHFLKDVFSGQRYGGFPVLPITTQPLENEISRDYYNMSSDQSGVCIETVDSNSNVYELLKPRDVLLAVDDLIISNEGLVEVPNIGKKIDYEHVVQMKYMNQTIDFTVLRSNEYELRLMSDLPHSQQLAPNTVYLSWSGAYRVRDPFGVVQQGVIPGLGCDDLSSKLKNPEFKLRVLQETSRRGHTHSEPKAYELLNISVPLKYRAYETKKIQQMEHDRTPTYYIATGFIFQPLTYNYLEAGGASEASSMVFPGVGRIGLVPKKTNGTEHFVIINSVLECKENRGYKEYTGSLIKEINGQEINNIHDVVRAIESNTEKDHLITLLSGGLTFPIANMARLDTRHRHEELLARYRHKVDRSEDLLTDDQKIQRIKKPSRAVIEEMETDDDDDVTLSRLYAKQRIQSDQSDQLEHKEDRSMHRSAKQSGAKQSNVLRFSAERKPRASLRQEATEQKQAFTGQDNFYAALQGIAAKYGKQGQYADEDVLDDDYGDDLIDSGADTEVYDDADLDIASGLDMVSGCDEAEETDAEDVYDALPPQTPRIKRVHATAPEDKAVRKAFRKK